MKMKWIILMIVALAAIAVAGCTTSSPAPSPTAPIATPTPPASTPAITTATPSPGPSAPSAASVTIQGFSFQPGTATIAQGGTVTWTNLDDATHIVKFPDGQSSGLSKGGTYSKKFDSVGSFDYVCGIHPSMHGTVKVV